MKIIAHWYKYSCEKYNIETEEWEPENHYYMNGHPKYPTDVQASKLFRNFKFEGIEYKEF